MDKSQIRLAVRRSLLAGMLVQGATLLAPPTLAADGDATDAKIEEVIVTGTRISRPDLDANSPVAVVSGADLKMSGTPNPEEYLRRLPQLVPAIGANTNNGNPGAATLDLRDLGEERTLVLVDGRRFVPYDASGFVDLNMIPAALIDRVEIVSGGASAVYGSDAIAGVVNFVYKKDFDGLELEGGRGQTQKSDAQRNEASLTVGRHFDDGRGNFVFNAGFIEQEAVYQGDREYSNKVLDPATLLSGNGSSTNASSTIRGIAAGNGQPAGTYTFDANGNLVPYVGARDGFNFNPYNLLVAPTKKWTATAVGRFALGESSEFFSRLSFANSRVSTIVAPSGTFNFGFDINYAANPFLSDQAKSVMARNDLDGDGVITQPIGRRTVELGTRDSNYENTAYQLVAGLRGQFANAWNWEAFGQFGRTVRTLNFLHDIDFSKLQQALLAVKDANGNIVCSDPSGGCVPANIWGAGNLSAAAGRFVGLDLQEADTTQQTVVGGFVGRDLPFLVPSAKRSGAFVVGVESRHESGDARPDAAFAAGLAPGFGQASPLQASFQTKEAYLELKLPLVTDKTFAHNLSLETGVRYSDYRNDVPVLQSSNSFETTAWKAGGEWRPVEALRFRALFQRAVRAPNLGEIGTPRTNGTGDATTDYCASETLTPADVANPANAQLVALCVATGTPLAGLQGGSVGGPISGQVSNYSGGNPGLVPEVSDTVTYGFVVQPKNLPSFTASVDYFDIKVDKAILSTPEQAILDACYQPSQNPGYSTSNVFCQLIHRNPLDGSLNGGIETGVDASARNIGFLKVRGIDVAGNYRLDLGAGGKLTLGLNLTDTLSKKLRFTQTGPVYECAGEVGKICLRPLPKLHWVQSTNWDRGPLSLQLTWRHLGELTQDTVARGEAPAADFAVPVIAKFDYFDIGASFEWKKYMVFRAGVENLFDKQPPIVGIGYGGTAENSGNTFPATYDPLGRSFFLTLSAKL